MQLLLKVEVQLVATVKPEEVLMSVTAAAMAEEVAPLWLVEAEPVDIQGMVARAETI
jgi:hypothetical protein